MILGAHHALHALAVLRREVVDMRADVGRADEGDCGDVRMGAQGVDRALAAVDDVEHAGRHARLQGEFREQHRRQRILLRGLEYEGVAADDGHGEHPQRDHGREVERRDAGAHADRLADGIGVDAAGDVLGKFAELQAADGAGMFDHLESAKHVALGVGQRLALLGAQGLGDAAHVLAHQRLQLEHDAGPRGEGRVLPALVGGLGGGDGGVDFIVGRKRHLGQDLLRGRD